jgi:hypothetical protein
MSDPLEPRLITIGEKVDDVLIELAVLQQDFKILAMRLETFARALGIALSD